MQCPKCKKPLKQRQGKFGEFWGCTGYPECRYTFTEKKGGYPNQQPSPEAPQLPTIDLKAENDKQPVNPLLLLTDEINALRILLTRTAGEIGALHVEIKNLTQHVINQKKSG